MVTVTAEVPVIARFCLVFDVRLVTDPTSKVALSFMVPAVASWINTWIGQGCVFPVPRWHDLKCNFCLGWFHETWILLGPCVWIVLACRMAIGGQIKFSYIYSCELWLKQALVKETSGTSDFIGGDLKKKSADLKKKETSGTSDFIGGVLETLDEAWYSAMERTCAGTSSSTVCKPFDSSMAGTSSGRRYCV